VGIVTSDLNCATAGELCRDLQVAANCAKQWGRNRCFVLTPSMRAQLQLQTQLEIDLARAIETAIDSQQFRLHYQPIFSLHTGQLAGFEALIRWQHPDYGLLLPGRFIPVAEALGLIHELDLWVMQVACEQLQSWQERYEFARHLFVTINFSPAQLQHITSLKPLQAIIERARIRPGSLKLEITESRLGPESVALNTLRQLEEQGVRLCIDDFGTGYSSLSRLHRFPISTLKIDRSFIERLRTNQDGAAVVQTIIALAHTLGMDVVAEGIENADQLNKLQALGCEYGQGFLFSEALDHRTATQLIERNGGISRDGYLLNEPPKQVSRESQGFQQQATTLAAPCPADLPAALEPESHFPADCAT
ncbi:MAG: EAL domain-containing protein, partial [Cyanobacteria bacterium P01_H01_bin.121]